MAFLTRDDVYQKFLHQGYNSSHFVWLLTPLQFFETTRGWTFALVQLGPVTLFALEPLMPESFAAPALSDFKEAFEEVRRELRPKVTAFVSIGPTFLHLLHALGFQSLLVGSEPWMNLSHCIPRGNSGKGVRSARNQALRAGLSVCEWTATELAHEPEKRSTLLTLTHQWQQTRVLRFTGFLNAINPLAYSESRRYFILNNSKNEPLGFLIATPIPAQKSYFLEDLIISKSAPNGAGELLTLDAMLALKDAGVKTASLGVVSMTSLQGTGPGPLNVPTSIRLLTQVLPTLVSYFYNFNGLEIFRKRFNPSHWKNTYLAVHNDRSHSQMSHTQAWLWVFLALIKAFQPRLDFSLSAWAQAIVRPVRKSPITWTLGGLSLILFGAINHFGRLPTEMLARFSFEAQAPAREWLYRSLVSNFLYLDFTHFGTCLVSLLAVTYWSERCQRRHFILFFVLCIGLLGDLIDYLVVIEPFHYLKPPLFQQLIAVQDVGGSLWLASILGLQISQLRRHREIIFALLCVISVFGFTITSNPLHTLVLNLNHFLFLSLGFITGRVRAEFERRRSRAVAKNKAPMSRYVFSPRN